MTVARASGDPLAQLADDPLDVRYKGFSPAITDATIAALATRASTLVDAGFSFPLLTLRRHDVEHNVAALADYCRRHDVQLAPHGKSTMSPELHAMQVAAGAWAMTAATVHEVAVYRAFGVARVLLANVLVDAAGGQWIAAELERDPDFRFYCYADSLDGVALLAEVLGGRAAPAGRVNVLVEVGYAGGRTGCRDVAAVLEVCRAINAQPGLRLAGVSGYEGLLGRDAEAATMDAVTSFVRSLRDAADAVLGSGEYTGEPGTFVVSCGGSAYFDVVTAELGAAWSRHSDTTVVLRPGSYVTHDDGLYEHVSPLTRSPGPAGPLRAALTIWAHVLSTPDPDRAIVGAGRRDVPYDAGLPKPKLVWRRGAPGPDRLDGAATVKVNDHHVYVDTPPGQPLAVGDLVGFGISHPCTAFDKWRLIPLVDDDWHVIGAVHTYF